MPVEVNGAFGVLEEQGRYLLVANWRTLDNRRVLCWDLPGGGVEPWESLTEGCIREMREETGFEVEVLDLAFMIERFGFRSEDPDSRSRYFFFHVRRLRDLGPPKDPKIVETAWKGPAELHTLCDQAYHKELHAWLASGGSRRYFLDVNLPGRRKPRG